MKTSTRTRLIFLTAGVMLTLQMNAESNPTGRYAQVNGLKLYYEIHGRGRPLVLLHGGGSTIESTYGRILPEFAKTRQVIAVAAGQEQQATDAGNSDD